MTNTFGACLKLLVLLTRWFGFQFETYVIHACPPSPGRAAGCHVDSGRAFGAVGDGGLDRSAGRRQEAAVVGGDEADRSPRIRRTT